MGERGRQEGGVLTPPGQGLRFTTRRERTLWLAAGAVVVAIWATLGTAGRLAARLEPTGLLAPAFGLGFFVAAVVVVGFALRDGTRGSAWAAVGIVAAYAMVFVRLGVAERSHLFEYGLVAVLVHAALLERRSGGGRVRAAALTAVVFTALLGWLDEGIQGLLPNRVYDLRDVAFNTVAAALAVGASVVLRTVRRARSC